MTSLVYGAYIDPIEDSTADNLRGLAHLIDEAHARGMEVRLTRGRTPAGAVLRLSATATMHDACAMAMTAAEAGIFPDLLAHCEPCKRELEALLEGASGVHVLLGPKEEPC